MRWGIFKQKLISLRIRYFVRVLLDCNLFETNISYSFWNIAINLLCQQPSVQLIVTLILWMNGHLLPLYATFANYRQHMHKNVDEHLLHLHALIATYRQHMHKNVHEQTPITSACINRYPGKTCIRMHINGHLLHPHTLITTYRQHMHKNVHEWLPGNLHERTSITSPYISMLTIGNTYIRMWTNEHLLHLHALITT